MCRIRRLISWINTSLFELTEDALCSQLAWKQPAYNNKTPRDEGTDWHQTDLLHTETISYTRAVQRFQIGSLASFRLAWFQPSKNGLACWQGGQTIIMEADHCVVQPGLETQSFGANLPHSWINSHTKLCEIEIGLAEWLGQTESKTLLVCFTFLSVVDSHPAPNGSCLGCRVQGVPCLLLPNCCQTGHYMIGHWYRPVHRMAACHIFTYGSAKGFTHDWTMQSNCCLTTSTHTPSVFPEHRWELWLW